MSVSVRCSAGLGLVIGAVSGALVALVLVLRKRASHASPAERGWNDLVDDAPVAHDPHGLWGDVS